MVPHTGGKWISYGTEHRKDNQLQKLELPVAYLNRESKHDLKKSEGNLSHNDETE